MEVLRHFSGVKRPRSLNWLVFKVTRSQKKPNLLKSVPYVPCDWLWGHAITFVIPTCDPQNVNPHVRTLSQKESNARLCNPNGNHAFCNTISKGDARTALSLWSHWPRSGLKQLVRPLCNQAHNNDSSLVAWKRCWTFNERSCSKRTKTLFPFKIGYLEDGCCFLEGRGGSSTNTHQEWWLDWSWSRLLGGTIHHKGTHRPGFGCCLGLKCVTSQLRWATSLCLGVTAFRWRAASQVSRR